jgi:hypothetical protein
MADKEKAATDSGDAKEAVASEGAPAKESKIAAKPEGFVSPYNFAKALGVHEGKGEDGIRPQTVYGMVRNPPKLKDGTPFPVETNSDGHYMIDTGKALAWWDTRKKERAESKAAKAAAATEAADKEAVAASE